MTPCRCHSRSWKMIGFQPAQVELRHTHPDKVDFAGDHVEHNDRDQRYHHPAGDFSGKPHRAVEPVGEVEKFFHQRQPSVGYLVIVIAAAALRALRRGLSEKALAARAGEGLF